MDQVRYELSANYSVMDDIDMTAYIAANYASMGWRPIGSEGTPFTGVLEGNDHLIYGLSIDRGLQDNVGLSNDYDSDGSELTVDQVESVTDGVLNLNADGSFDYTPDPGFVGSDSFTYRADNGYFDPESPVKTQDAMIMIARALREYKGMDVNPNVESISGVSEYAAGDVAALMELDIVEDDFDDGITSINREFMGELVYALYFFD